MVTGQSIDGQRLRLAENLGAEPVNIEERDPVKVSRELTEGLGVRTVFDSTGSSRTIKGAIQMTRKGGEIVLIGLASLPEEILFSEIVRTEKTIRGSMNYVPDTWRSAINLYREDNWILDRSLRIE